MTTKWADGFEDDGNDTTAQLAVDYSVSGTDANISNVTGRRTGTSALRLGTSCNITRTIGGTQTTMFSSMGYSCDDLSQITTSRTFLRFQESSTVHVSISVNSSGQLEAYRGDRTTLLGTSSAFVTSGTWTWLQVKVVIHDSTGSVEIRDASGNVILNLTGQDTRNGGTPLIDTVSAGYTGAFVALTAFDDWHVWDSTGSICNTWTNDTRVDHKLPTGAGNSAQFTPSTGSNYACVDEANWNTTDYVESSTAGHKDTYAFGDISHSPPNIYAVLLTAVAQKDDAGARSLKMVSRSGGTDYSGSATTLNQGSYSRVVDVREADPATSAAWTQSGWNSSEVGFENV